MTQRIASNITSEIVQKNLRDISKEEGTQLNQISSGKRITKASDDSAGLAVATNLRAQVNSLRQATRNANEGISLIQTAEGGLSEISNILIRLRELSIQSSTDTVGDEEREMIDREYQELTQEVDRIAYSTIYNRMNLLSDENAGVVNIHVGPFADEENIILIDTDITDATTGALGISGSAVYDKDEALDSLSYLDDAISELSNQRAHLGALQGRLQHAVTNLEGQVVNQEYSRSMIEDVDIAHATAKLTLTNIKKAAANSALVQANNLPASTLSLVR